MNEKYKEKKLKNTRISVKPFIYNIPSISSVSIRLLVLLSIQILMLIITGSIHAFFVVMVSLIGSIAAAVINYYVRKEPV